MRSLFAKGATAVLLAAAVAVPAKLNQPLTRKPAHAPPAPPAAPAGDPADRALYERLCAQVASLYDSTRGGFVRKDGRPSEVAIELALARGADGDTLALGRALATLRWMHGLLDTVGGGYVEGVRDLDIRSDAFEKRTDSNLSRLDLLARVAARPGEPFAKDARAVVDYAERLLVDPLGGFATAQIGSRDLEPESNGIALRGWWRWAVATGDPRRRDFAFKSHDRLWKDCRDDDLGLVRRNTWGKIREPSLLADQAEIGRAFVFGWQAAGRDSDLARARAIGTHVREHFEDLKQGGFRSEYAYERFGHSRRGARPFEDNAVAARFLAELGAATADTSWTNAARRAWGAFGKQFDKPKFETAAWALAVRATWAGPDLARSDWGVKAAKKAAPAGKGKGAKAKKGAAGAKR